MGREGQGKEKRGKTKIPGVWIWKNKFYLLPSFGFWDKKTNALTVQVQDLTVALQTLTEFMCIAL